MRRTKGGRNDNLMGTRRCFFDELFGADLYIGILQALKMARHSFSARGPEESSFRLRVNWLLCCM